MKDVLAALIMLIIMSVPFWFVMIAANFDKIKYFIKTQNDYKQRKKNIIKLVQLKLISTNIKEIEDFITNNVEFLDSKTILKLVVRIEEIRLEMIIK